MWDFTFVDHWLKARGDSSICLTSSFSIKWSNDLPLQKWCHMSVYNLSWSDHPDQRTLESLPKRRRARDPDLWNYASDLTSRVFRLSLPQGEWDEYKKRDSQQKQTPEVPDSIDLRIRAPVELIAGDRRQKQTVHDHVRPIQSCKKPPSSHAARWAFLTLVSMVGMVSIVPTQAEAEISSSPRQYD